MAPTSVEIAGGLSFPTARVHQCARVGGTGAPGPTNATPNSMEGWTSSTRKGHRRSAIAELSPRGGCAAAGEDPEHHFGSEGEAQCERASPTAAVHGAGLSLAASFGSGEGGWSRGGGVEARWCGFPPCRHWERCWGEAL